MAKKKQSTTSPEQAEPLKEPILDAGIGFEDFFSDVEISEGQSLYTTPEGQVMITAAGQVIDGWEETPDGDLDLVLAPIRETMRAADRRAVEAESKRIEEDRMYFANRVAVLQREGFSPEVIEAILGESASPEVLAALNRADSDSNRGKDLGAANSPADALTKGKP